MLVNVRVALGHVGHQLLEFGVLAVDARFALGNDQVGGHALLNGSADNVVQQARPHPFFVQRGLDLLQREVDAPLRWHQRHGGRHLVFVDLCHAASVALLPNGHGQRLFAAGYLLNQLLDARVVLPKLTIALCLDQRVDVAGLQFGPRYVAVGWGRVGGLQCALVVAQCQRQARGVGCRHRRSRCSGDCRRRGCGYGSGGRWRCRLGWHVCCVGFSLDLLCSRLRAIGRGERGLRWRRQYGGGLGGVHVSPPVGCGCAVAGWARFAPFCAVCGNLTTRIRGAWPRNTAFCAGTLV